METLWPLIVLHNQSTGSVVDLEMKKLSAFMMSEGAGGGDSSADRSL